MRGEHAGRGRRFSRLSEIFTAAFKLGLTSFGGPIAHLGYFHHEYIRRRQWLDERAYADLVALCQFLPGPTSSQVGIGIGIIRGGWLGGLAAWTGFTLPSLLLMIGFAFIFQGTGMSTGGWVHGLKLVAVAVVAHAVLDMGRKLAPDRQRATLAVLAAIVALLWPHAMAQVLVIAAAGVFGFFAYRKEGDSNGAGLTIPIQRKGALLCLLVFFAVLLLFPLLRSLADHKMISLFDGFYRAGSLVFGGGHVVLPLLQREAVGGGWVSEQAFLAGYGAAQAVPGPLFTFAAYLGTLAGGLWGAIIATLAVFLPGWLLIAGTLPFWERLRTHSGAKGALDGIHAAVVGILLAALYDPLWVSSMGTALDFALCALLFVLLVFWKLPPWIVVLAGAAGGMLIV